MLIQLERGGNSCPFFIIDGEQKGNESIREVQVNTLDNRPSFANL